jgi:hypothetical protein
LFSHHFLPKVELEVKTINGKRHYVTPEGRIYRSVTTIINDSSDDTILKHWVDRVGKAEADRISDRSRTRGNNVHKLIEQFLLNESIDFGKVMPINLMLYKQIVPILEKHVTKIYGIEFPLYSDRLKTAGRTDLIADYDGIPSIIDFKGSSRTKKAEWIKDYFIQETTYSCCLFEKYKMQCKQLVTIIAVEEHFPQVFIKTVGEYLDDTLRIFLSQGKAL